MNNQGIYPTEHGRINRGVENGVISDGSGTQFVGYGTELISRSSRS